MYSLLGLRRKFIPEACLTFRASEKEPVCAELERELYTSLRKNRLHPLDSWEDSQEYVRNINKNASVRFTDR